MSILSEIDGVEYTSGMVLRFTRPAVCLTATDGTQKVVASIQILELLKGASNGNRDN